MNPFEAAATGKQNEIDLICVFARHLMFATDSNWVSDLLCGTDREPQLLVPARRLNGLRYTTPQSMVTWALFKHSWRPVL